MRLYSHKDVDRKALKGARIAILGYGSQGRAHALNLKDSGFDVVVGVRKGGASWKKARRDGLEVAEPTAAAASADLVAMLVPDLAQKALYQDVKKSLKKGAALLFAHGFNIHFKQVKPRADLDVVLIAPKGPGDLVRRQYQQGRGVPCLIAVAQDATGNAQARALAYAHGIGGTRGGVLETAKYGDLTRGPRIVDERVKKQMRKVLKEVQSGKFARQWIKENETGKGNYQKMLAEDMNRQIEKVGASLRARMPWLNEKRA